MKIEVDLRKKYILAVFGIALLLGGIAFSIAQPNIFGHKASEIFDWSEVTISQINVSKICIGNDCRTAWPTGTGQTVAICTQGGQYCSCDSINSRTISRITGSTCSVTSTAGNCSSTNLAGSCCVCAV